MPDYVKIGRCDNLRARMGQLYNTSVPLPFQCHYAARVENPEFVERQLHAAFHDNRKSPRREFFVIAPERVVAALKLVELEDVTAQAQSNAAPTEEEAQAQDASDRAFERRTNLTFTMLQIPVGTVLTFSRNPNITCEVMGDREVQFRDEAMSLSAAARAAFHQNGELINYGVQGSAYWQLDGQTLHELRLALEDERD